MKKALKIAGIGILGLFIALLLLPFLFEDEIKKVIKEEINQSINAKVDFSDVDLSFIRAFPKASLRIDDLNVVGIDSFDNQNLLSAKYLRLDFDIWSVFNKNVPVEVHNIIVDQGILNIVLQNGLTNYDILKESKTTETETDPFIFNLKYFDIKNSVVSYDDYDSNQHLSIEDYNQTGSGVFQGQEFDVSNKLDLNGITYTNGLVSYLKKANLNAESQIIYDSNANAYNVENSFFKLNDFLINVEGKAQINDNIPDLDFTFSSPNNDVKSIISILPNIYTSQFDKIKTKGKYEFKGFVKGKLDMEKENYPTFGLDLLIHDGYFKHPDLIKAIENIDVNVSVANAKSKLDGIIIDVKKGNFVLDNAPFESKILLTNLINNPNFDIKLKGDLNLKTWTEAYPMEEIKDMQGIVNVDIETKGDKASILNVDFDALQFKNIIRASEISIVSASYPKIKINDLLMVSNKEILELTSKSIDIGESKVAIQAEIKDPLKLIFPQDEITGTLNLTSSFLNLDELLPPPTDSIQTSESEYIRDLLDAFKIDLNFMGDKIKYSPYILVDNKGKGTLHDNSIDLVSYSTKIGNSDMVFNGQLSNLYAYSFKNENLQGNLDLNSDLLVLDDFMTEVDSNVDSIAIGEVALVPKNMDIQVNAKAKTIKYGKITLKDATSLVQIVPNEVYLKDFVGNALGGKVNMEGLYNTKEPSNPLYSFKYNMDHVKFSSAFNQINSFKLLAPLAEYIDGLFNTTLIMNGSLLPDMTPNLGTITGSGFLETLDGKIKGYEHLKKVNELFNIDAGKEWIIKNSKNWFEIENGKLTLKEFNYKFQEFDFKINGWNKLDQELFYVLNTNVPRQILSKTTIGAEANKLLDDMLKNIGKVGLNVDSQENINVDLEISGTLTKPKFKIIPRGLGSGDIGDQLKDQVTAKVEQTKEAILDSLNREKEKIKTQLEDKAESVKDTVTSRVEKEVNKALDTVKTKATDIIKTKLDSTLTDKASDILGKDAKSEVDSIKSKLDNWNPFKKKKK